MNIDLLELPTKELFDKIGAGSHKPGSGSVSALNGILSSKLLLTVIELTLDPRRIKTYGRYSKELAEIKLKIENTKTDKFRNRKIQKKCFRFTTKIY